LCSSYVGVKFTWNWSTTIWGIEDQGGVHVLKVKRLEDVS
jgi:hypothetical protein